MCIKNTLFYTISNYFFYFEGKNNKKRKNSRLPFYNKIYHQNLTTNPAWILNGACA